MSNSKLNDLAGKFGKGGPQLPPGLGIGLKLLAAVGAAMYGVSQSIYTGMFLILRLSRNGNFKNCRNYITSIPYKIDINILCFS